MSEDMAEVEAPQPHVEQQERRLSRDVEAHPFLSQGWGMSADADAPVQHGIVVRNTFIDVRSPEVESGSDESPCSSPKQRKRNVSAPPSPTRQRTPWSLRPPGQDAVDGSDQEELEEDQSSIPNYQWTPEGGLVQGGADGDELTATVGNPDSPKRLVRRNNKFWYEPPHLAMPESAEGPPGLQLPGGSAATATVAEESPGQPLRQKKRNDNTKTGDASTRIPVGSTLRTNANPAMSHVPPLAVGYDQPYVGDSERGMVPGQGLDLSAGLGHTIGEIGRLDLSLGQNQNTRSRAFGGSLGLGPGLGLGGGLAHGPPPPPPGTGTVPSHGVCPGRAVGYETRSGFASMAIGQRGNLEPHGFDTRRAPPGPAQTCDQGGDQGFPSGFGPALGTGLQRGAISSNTSHGLGLGPHSFGFGQDVWQGLCSEQDQRGFPPGQGGASDFIGADGMSTEAPAYVLGTAFRNSASQPMTQHPAQNQQHPPRKRGGKQRTPVPGSAHGTSFGDTAGYPGQLGRNGGLGPTPAFPGAVQAAASGAYGTYPPGRTGSGPAGPPPGQSGPGSACGMAAGVGGVGQHHGFGVDAGRGLAGGDDSLDAGLLDRGRSGRGRSRQGGASGRGRGRSGGPAVDVIDDLSDLADIGGGKGQPFVMKGAAAAAAAAAQQQIAEDTGQSLGVATAGAGRVPLSGGGPKRTDYIRKYGPQSEESGQPAVPITTVMLKNIPCRKCQEEVMMHIDRKDFGGRYDFFYLPRDVKFRANLGYAFINFLSPEDASRFQTEMNGYRFAGSGSSKACIVVPAHVQGLVNNLAAFKRTEVMRSSRKPYFSGVVTL